MDYLDDFIIGPQSDECIPEWYDEEIILDDIE